MQESGGQRKWTKSVKESPCKEVEEVWARDAKNMWRIIMQEGGWWE